MCCSPRARKQLDMIEQQNNRDHLYTSGRLMCTHMCVCVIYMCMCMSFLTVSVSLCACLVTESCLTFCDPMDGSLPGASVHGIFQVRTLQRVIISSSRPSSLPRDQTHLLCVCCIGRQTLYHQQHTSLSPSVYIYATHLSLYIYIYIYIYLYIYIHTIII